MPLEKQTASGTIAIKAEAYGMPGVRADGNDVLAVYQVASEAAERARNGGGPTLIELLTYRRGPHSSSDDPTRYRGTQADEWLKRDPILRFRKHLELLDLWSEEKEHELSERVKAEINASVAKVEKLPPPPLRRCSRTCTARCRATARGIRRPHSPRGHGPRGRPRRGLPL